MMMSFPAVQLQGSVNLEVRMMDQDTRLLCSLDPQGSGRPLQLPWSVRLVSSWFEKCLLWILGDDLWLLCLDLFVLTCRSWASAMWKWMPAAHAAKTAWRMLSQSRLTIRASKTSTKVFFLFVSLCSTCLLISVNHFSCDCFSLKG